MFFPDKISSVKPTDKVLEIGPGAAPHPRSDIFLERTFSQEEAFRQRGWTPAKELEKPVVFYDGSTFPFKDKEFDYVICSHVLEHVDDVDKFLKELSRVAHKGYLEFPTIYYDFIYNIPEHQTFLHYDGEKVLWIKKEATGIQEFSKIQKLLHESMGKGYHHIVDQLQDIFFQGFEWFDEIGSMQTTSIDNLLPDIELCHLRENRWSDQFSIVEKSRISFAPNYDLLASDKIQAFLNLYRWIRTKKDRLFKKITG